MVKALGGLESYTIVGTVSDNGWLYRNRTLLESHMRDDMLANDVLPALDVPVAVTCSYLEETEFFEFSLIAVGYKVDSTEGYVGAIVEDGVALSVDGKRVTIIEEV
jgi:hypothetical protein